MTIDGTNISAYGLIVKKITGNFDLPARKKVLTEPSFDSGDQTIKEKVYTIELFGQYADQSALGTSVNGFRTLLESDLTHDFVEPNRGYAFSGVVRDGFSAKVFRNDVTILFVVALT